ncbi:hypothetical protein [Nonomuraea sp. 10N515B]|uniref:hypothetical protein n=1 Tax=Nonomuraea sp. 10N515B TaxID=3457422 RepID=UPI003FCE9017
MIRRLAPFALALAACAPQGTPPPAVERASGLPPIRAELEPVPWAGGPAYYKRFKAAAEAGWSKPSFFPVGVWYASLRAQQDVDKDRKAGINTYVELTQDSDMGLVRSNRMSAITSGPRRGAGPETVGWFLATEADMWAGAGVAKWSGAQGYRSGVCLPEGKRCGFTVMDRLARRLPEDGHLRYANYGKGVMYWHSSEQAAEFVNGYTNVVSTGVHWYTDPAACDEGERFLRMPSSQCRLSANYGAVIDRQRLLDAEDGSLQPIFALVELGHPSQKSGGTIRPEQMKGAVMSSLIHEASGIIYLGHNFGGPCRTVSLLREPCGDGIRPAVTEVNGQIRQLAPVLNTQSYRYGYAPELDTMLKRYRGAYYLFAMVARGASTGRHTLAVPANLSTARQVEVLFEGRTVPVGADGQFTDSFDTESTYHIYKIETAEGRS